MLVNEKVAIEHRLKADEYKKICDLLTREIDRMRCYFFFW